MHILFLNDTIACLELYLCAQYEQNFKTEACKYISNNQCGGGLECLCMMHHCAHEYVSSMFSLLQIHPYQENQSSFKNLMILMSFGSLPSLITGGYFCSDLFLFFTELSVHKALVKLVKGRVFC